MSREKNKKLLSEIISSLSGEGYSILEYEVEDNTLRGVVSKDKSDEQDKTYFQFKTTQDSFSEISKALAIKLVSKKLQDYYREREIESIE